MNLDQQLPSPAANTTTVTTANTTTPIATTVFPTGNTDPANAGPNITDANAAASVQNANQTTNAADTTNPNQTSIDPDKDSGDTDAYERELSDLEENFTTERNQMIDQISTLNSTFFKGRSSEHLKKIFRKITDRCFNEIQTLSNLNFLDPRQTELRWKVQTKLDKVRQDIAKLEKHRNFVQRRNDGYEKHVCRDIKNFYLQV